MNKLIHRKFYYLLYLCKNSMQFFKNFKKSNENMHLKTEMLGIDVNSTVRSPGKQRASNIRLITGAAINVSAICKLNRTIKNVFT